VIIIISVIVLCSRYFAYLLPVLQENEAHIADLLGASFASQPQVETHWFSESGVIDLFLMLGPAINDVFYQYQQLTGSTPLPPVQYSLC